MQTRSEWFLRKYRGILNAKKYFRMMPRPERMIDEMISNKDGVNLFSSLLN